MKKLVQNKQQKQEKAKNVKKPEELLLDPKERIKQMEDALQSIKDAKIEGAQSKILEMSLDEKREWKNYPCDYDYIVEEKNQLYIVYGWKQSKFPISKLPQKEKEEILRDYNDGNYREKVNRVPLTDAQLCLFEDLLEENLSMDIIDELKIYYKLQKVTPVFEDDKDGYKKKIFEGFIFAQKTKFTIRVGDLKLDINPHDFLIRNRMIEERCHVQKRKIDERICELCIGFENIRDYRRWYLILRARKYDLQENSKSNQTLLVLKIIKQMYAEVYQKFYDQIKSIQSCENGEFDISPDLAEPILDKNKKIVKSKTLNEVKLDENKNSRKKSPPPMKFINFGDEPNNKKESNVAPKAPNKKESSVSLKVLSIKESNIEIEEPNKNKKEPNVSLKKKESNIEIEDKKESNIEIEDKKESNIEIEAPNQKESNIEIEAPNQKESQIEAHNQKESQIEAPNQKESQIEALKQRDASSQEKIIQQIENVSEESTVAVSEQVQQSNTNSQSGFQTNIFSLILDMQKVFQFIQNNKQCKFQKIAVIQDNKRYTHKQVLDFILPLCETLQKNQELSISQISSFEKLFNLRNVQNFIDHMKNNSSLNLSSISSELKILK